MDGSFDSYRFALLTQLVQANKRVPRAGGSTNLDPNTWLTSIDHAQLAFSSATRVSFHDYQRYSFFGSLHLRSATSISRLY